MRQKLTAAPLASPETTRPATTQAAEVTHPEEEKRYDGGMEPRILRVSEADATSPLFCNVCRPERKS